MAESHVFDEIIDFLNFDLFDGDVIIIIFLRNSLIITGSQISSA